MSLEQKQLRLPMDAFAGYEAGEWIRHDGVEEACNRLALWTVHGGNLWLSSESPAGKSHLLRMLASEYRQCGLLNIDGSIAHGAGWRLVQQWVGELNSRAMWLLDLPPGTLPTPVAYAVFHCLERARDMQRPLVLAWRGDLSSCPPELSSRLGAMDRVSMAPPKHDEDLLALLKAGASWLQWDIREQVLCSMLVYLPRRLDVLIPALRRLERLSFEQRQKPAGSWLKQQLIGMAEKEAQLELLAEGERL